MTINQWNNWRVYRMDAIYLYTDITSSYEHKITALEAETTWQFAPITADNDLGGTTDVAYQLSGMISIAQNNYTYMYQLLKDLANRAINGIEMVLYDNVRKIYMNIKSFSTTNVNDVNQFNITNWYIKQNGHYPILQIEYNVLFSVDIINNTHYNNTTKQNVWEIIDTNEPEYTDGYQVIRE
jgi:hypothetical protein